MGRSQCRCASVGGGKHNLVGIFLPEVANYKNASYVCLAFLICDDITGGVHSDSGRDKLIVRNKANKNEDTFDIHFPTTPVRVSFKEIPFTPLVSALILVTTAL